MTGNGPKSAGAAMALRMHSVAIDPNADIHAHSHGAINAKRACPPQTRSPAMSSQGFTSLPLAVASFRHVTVAYAGLS
jgi:hypothetical protein